MKTLTCWTVLTFAILACALAQQPVTPTLPAVSIGTVPVPQGRAVAPGKFLNLSLRATVAQDTDPVIAGFVVDDTVYALIRVVGPSLSRFNVVQPSAEPSAQLYIGGRPVGGSRLQPWSEQGEVAKGVFRTVSSQVGAFPLQEGSKDLVMLLEGQKESYTIVLSSVRGSGSILIEVYLVPAAVINGE